MITFPGSPRLVKGAIVGIDIFNPVASFIVFQYNPATITRTLKSQMADTEEDGSCSQAISTKGPRAPTETIQLEAEIDAADQLEQGNNLAENLGIYPQLSALEMLLYPKSVDVILNQGLLSAGTTEVIPPLAPTVLLVWGLKRVVPIRLNEFSITEDAYDPSLNPIRATVSLTMRVLSYNDFSVTDPGYHLFLAHQITKEAMATSASIQNINQVVSSVIDRIF